jgi:hypothetical protein
MKCVVAARLWCTGMSAALRPVDENHEGKGLSVSRGWVGDEEKPRVIGVVYRPTARAQGFLLNVCPWCEAPLLDAATGRDQVINAAQFVLLGWMGDGVDGGKAMRGALLSLKEAFDRYEKLSPGRKATTDG